MNVFDIIYEQPEMLGEADSIDTADDLKNAFTRQQWFNIFTVVADSHLKTKSDDRKFEALKDLNNLLGQNSNNVSPSDWNSDAQLYGIRSITAGPGATWQDIYNMLAPHKDKKSSIEKPEASKDPVKIKVDKSGTLSLVASWVPVPEKETLNAEEAREYFMTLVRTFEVKATPEFAEYWKLPSNDPQQGDNFLRNLFIKTNEKIKKDLDDDGEILTQRVQNLFAAWLDAAADIYRKNTGKKPFKRGPDDVAADPGGA